MSRMDRPRRVTVALVAALFLLAACVSWLQANSGAHASPVERWGRLVWFAGLGVLYLNGRQWARWLLAISGSMYALWFARQVLVQQILVWKGLVATAWPERVDVALLPGALR